MTDISAQSRRFDRRKFLVGSGAMVVAVGTPRLLEPAGGPRGRQGVPDRARRIVDPNQIDSWLAIKGDGTVVVKTGKEELGQGMATAVAQVVADELDVAARQDHADQLRHVVRRNQGGTSGSKSSPTQFNPRRRRSIRKAAAEARAALLGLAVDRARRSPSRT